MSKTDLKKAHKPIMEKRRRARINQSLNEIKTILVEALKKDTTKYSKLEKADILEMAVKHLQTIQRQQLMAAVTSDLSILKKFKCGFNDCLEEIDKYVQKFEGIDLGLQYRIKKHLQKYLQDIERNAEIKFHERVTPRFFEDKSQSMAPNFNKSSLITPVSTGDQNNNPQINNLQFVSSCLRSGEVALLIPNFKKIPCSLNLVVSKSTACNTDLRQHPENKRQSAFVSVMPTSRITIETDYLQSEESPLYRKVENRVNAQYQKVRDESSPPFLGSTIIENKAINFQNTLEFLENKGTAKKCCTHNSSEKEDSLCQKFGDPLNIITNHEERYRQAQIKEESTELEENRILQVSSNTQRNCTPNQDMWRPW